MLLIATVVSLLLANSAIGVSYTELWSMYLGPLTLGYWINDGLMAIFFFLVGLEIDFDSLKGKVKG